MQVSNEETLDKSLMRSMNIHCINVILRIARNLMETRKNIISIINIEFHPFYQIICDL